MFPLIRPHAAVRHWQEEALLIMIWRAGSVAEGFGDFVIPLFRFALRIGPEREEGSSLLVSAAPPISEAPRQITLRGRANPLTRNREGRLALTSVIPWELYGIQLHEDRKHAIGHPDQDAFGWDRFAAVVHPPLQARRQEPIDGCLDLVLGTLNLKVSLTIHCALDKNVHERWVATIARQAQSKRATQAQVQHDEYNQLVVSEFTG